MDRMLRIKPRTIYLLGVGYLALPVGVWAMGWLRIGYAAAAAALLCVGFALVTRSGVHVSAEDETVCLSWRQIAAIVAVIILWCLLGGHGGLLFQTSDWSARNAVYRDLITHDWPVVYETGNALCYYFGFWLVPTLITKGVGLILADAAAVWAIGNILLTCWVVWGVYLVVLLVLVWLKRWDRRAITMTLVTLIFFSGLDIVGLLLFRSPDEARWILSIDMHIEWWADAYQFSSFTTQLYWVFNQAIPAWVATMLILVTDDVRNDICIGVLAAFLCPLPTMGLIFIGLAKLIGDVRRLGANEACAKLASPQNLLSLLLLIPIALFLGSSQRATSAPAGEPLFNTWIGGMTPCNVLRLAVFALLEYGIYLLLIFRNEWHNEYWWAAALSLPIINVVRMGWSTDFEMRASIPALLVVALLVCRAFVAGGSLPGAQDAPARNCEEPIGNKRRLIALAIVVVLGAVTPCIEIIRGPVRCVQAGALFQADSSLETFEGTDNMNFVMLGYEDSTFAQLVGR